MSDPFDDLPYVEEHLETIIVTRDANDTIAIESNITMPAGDITEDDIVLALLARASVLVTVQGLGAADDPSDGDPYQVVAEGHHAASCGPKRGNEMTTPPKKSGKQSPEPKEGRGFVAHDEPSRPEIENIQENVEIVTLKVPPERRPLIWPFVLAFVFFLAALVLIFWLNPTNLYVHTRGCVVHIVSYPWYSSGHIRCR